MANQLFAAQDQIGATERKSTIQELKNRQLETEVASWSTAYNEKLVSHANPIASSSTIPNTV